MSPVFPIGILLSGRRCLVVGNSAEAAARAQRLLEAGAIVRLVSPCPGDEALALEHEAGIEFCRRAYRPSDIDDCWLAVLADIDQALAQSIAADATRARIFFCAVDQPAHNSFAHLAIAKSGPLIVGISTSGASPAFARRLREELQRAFDESRVSGFLETAAEMRRRLAPARRRAVLTSWMSRVRLACVLSLPPPPGDGDGPH